MDLRKIKKLIELVEESGIAELEVKSGDEAVRISMAGGAVAAVPVAASSTQVAAVAPVDVVDESGQDSAVEAQPGAAGRPLATPLSGTFYTAPSPDAAPFVEVGSQVAAGDVVCIVESMKMMNRIEADRAGTVTAVLVDNGEPVETGQTLFLIDG